MVQDNVIGLVALASFVRISSMKEDKALAQTIPMPSWVDGVDIDNLPLVPDIDIP